MLLFARLAIRNLLRHKRRTILTAGSIAIGLGIVLWLSCIVAGRSVTMITTVTSSFSGQLQIYQNEYLKDRNIKYTFGEIPEIFIKHLPHGSTFSDRIHLPALASSGENSAPIQLVGIDPAKESLITNLHKQKIQGSFFSPDPSSNCATKEIYVGKKLADSLNVKLGTQLVILAQASDGTLGNELFTVSGLFESKSQSFDKSFTFIPIGCAKNLAVLQGIHETVVNLPTISLLDDASFLQTLSAQLPSNMKLTTWKETQPIIAGLVRFNDALVAVITIILYSVLILGIINTMFMSVMERTKEFGVMIALGTTPRQVVTIVIIEGLILGVVSSLLGIFLAAIVIAYHLHAGFDISILMGTKYDMNQFSFDPIVYPLIELSTIIRTIVLTIIFVVISGILPAIKTAKLDPVKAMS